MRCQKHKTQQQMLPGKLHARNTEQPWETISADLVGPLPRSERQNTWLLVLQDKFTNWIELQSLRKATGSVVAKALREKIFLHHRCPKKIIMDIGSQFVAKEFKDVLQNSGVQHQLTPPYAPQCNPVERANKVIKTMIAQTVEKS